MWSGKSDLDDINASEIINSASEYKINQDKLQSALENLKEYEDKLFDASNEATDYTPTEGAQWPSGGGPYDSRVSSATNPEAPVLADPPDGAAPGPGPAIILPDPEAEKPEVHWDNLYDSYKHKERLATPDYLVANDPILAGSSDYFETDDNSSINQQAVEFMNKLIIPRNAFIDVNAQLDFSQDFWDFDDIDQSGLVQKRINFLMIGKPGIGLTTFAAKFALKMNLVYISPATAVDYFNSQFTSELNMGGWDDRVIFEFICKRIQMLDVHHRGYILDGWPMIRSEDISIVEQLEMIRLLPYQPDLVFVMQMQDKDLFRRRVDQKLDPITMQVYIKKHYIRSSIGVIDLEGVNNEIIRKSIDNDRDSQSNSTFTVSTNANIAQNVDRNSEIDSEDFKPLRVNIVGRLISRLEDHPAQVERDFDKFRKAVPAIQAFINSLDRTKVFELDAYWPPNMIMKNAMSIIKALGIIPACSPMEIFRPVEKLKTSLRSEDEVEGYSSDEEGCIPDPNDPETAQKLADEFPPNWEAVMRAVVVRGMIDPRFRWRISKWKNLCPVSLKEGRSIAGRAELAFGLHNKVYFLSSPEAIQKFAFNPRQYLVKSMPTSPIKFFIVGHPLAGKTSFAHELAKLTGGRVVDMKKQVTKRLESVKQRYLFKTRFETTMAAKKTIDRENFESWKRDERNRREKVQKWIADYIRRKAAEEINKALEAEREERMKKYRQMRRASEYHQLSASFKSSPCNDGRLAFSWKKFVEDIRKGKHTWALQEQLELALDLFRKGLLRYKKKKGPLKLPRLQRGGEMEGEGEEEPGEESEEEAEEETVEEESVGEMESESDVGEEEEPRKRRRRRKRRSYCKKPKPVAEVAVLTDVEDPSPLFSDAEPDESLRMRYPEMCLELTEAVPKPPPTCDQDERVQDLVKVKLEETEKWADSLPSEIYEEILRMGLRDAEECFQENFPYAHFTGGWIVENLISEVEKWRSILRTPDICPDQIFVLQDTSPEFVKLVNNLKRVYAASHPGRKISMRQKRMREMMGEDGEFFNSPPPELEPETESDHIDPIIYPKDDLQGRPCTTQSVQKQLEIDEHRHQSRITSADTTTSSQFYEKMPNQSENFCTNEVPSVQPSEMKIEDISNIPPECQQKPWHTVASLKKLELVPAPTKKLLPCEMHVILPYEKAVNLALHKIDDTIPEPFDLEEWDGESPDFEESHFSNLPPILELEGEDAEAEEMEKIRTPSGINSIEDLCTVLAMAGEDGEEWDLNSKCAKKMSIKKSFLKQIAQLDEFWNMILPNVNQQKIKFFPVGIVDEETAPIKALKFWTELENRFKNPPKIVTEGDLEEDDVDVNEAKSMWDKTAKDKPKKQREERGEFDGEEAGEDEDDEDSEGSHENSEEENYMGRAKNSLKRLERKPDEYRTALADIENNRLFGSYNYYCPVTLLDSQVIRKGSPKFAARYQDRLYYMTSAENLSRFLKDPVKFLPKTPEKCIPPPRICITGAPSCGQKEVAMKMAEKAEIYYVNFRERLHQLIKSRLGRDVGPQFTGEIATRIDTASDQSEEEEEQEAEEEGEFDPNTEWIKEKQERKEMELKALKSLGIVQNVQVKSHPMDSIPRTEVKANSVQIDGKLTSLEKHVQAFLESGAQLPSFVLNEFIPALWQEEPFKSTGFILAGFPNSAKDVQYLCEHNYWPEQIYIMECKKKTLRNRLLRETMGIVSKLKGKRKPPKKNDRLNQISRQKTSPFDYQDLNVEKLEEDLPLKKKIEKALLHYHYMYTNKAQEMKIELNHQRIDWASFSTDLSLLEGKNKLIQALTPVLRYRENIFEVTYVLYLQEAEALLQKRYFHLSRFKRSCPVEISKRNTGINLWNAPGVTKYPVLYRNYIYFIAGQENLQQFRTNVIAMTKQSTPTPSVPFHVVIIGPPKAGKTEISKRIAQNLGLLYVHEDDVIKRIIHHARAATLEYEDTLVLEGPQPMNFATKVETYLRKGHSIPRYMVYRSLDFILLEPLAQHHGVVFDGYPMEDTSLQELLERGVIPGLIVELDIDLEVTLARTEKERRVPSYEFKDFVQDCDELMTIKYNHYGPMKSPCLYWYASQMKCLLNLNGTQNPAAIAEIVEKECKAAQVLKQEFILELMHNRTVKQSGLFI